jgi:3'(2'), 5'-bisphosphate nucleotidase
MILFKEEGCVITLESFVTMLLALRKEVMEIYHSKSHDIEIKSDESPVTKADKIASQMIESYLNKTPFVVVSEESDAEVLSYEYRKNLHKYWLIDPIDGTKHFIKMDGEFTVNIAFIIDAKPVFGAIYIPAVDKLYIGSRDIGTGGTIYLENLAQKNSAESLIPKQLMMREAGSLVTIATTQESKKSQKMQEFVRSLEQEYSLIVCGSSIKFCLLAEGKADIYPRFQDCSEWDVAAGDAIIKYAGGELIDLKTSEEMRYTKESLLVNHFIAKKR